MQMQNTGKVTPEKVVALQALRQQLGQELGQKITSGAELLEEQEGRESRWASGREDWDNQLGGGWARGQLTELVAPEVSSGSGLVMSQLLAQARRERRYAMLLDVGQGFSLETLPAADLETLLWVGCGSAREAIEALDVASRDENFFLFLVDLRDSDPSDWRSVKASQWYRVLGQLRQRESVAILFVRQAVTSVAKQRLELKQRFSWESLEGEREVLKAAVQLERSKVQLAGREHDRRRGRHGMSGLRGRDDEVLAVG